MPRVQRVALGQAEVRRCRRSPGHPSHPAHPSWAKSTPSSAVSASAPASSGRTTSRYRTRRGRADSSRTACRKGGIGGGICPFPVRPVTGEEHQAGPYPLLNTSHSIPSPIPSHPVPISPLSHSHPHPHPSPSCPRSYPHPSLSLSPSPCSWRQDPYPTSRMASWGRSSCIMRCRCCSCCPWAWQGGSVGGGSAGGGSSAGSSLAAPLTMTKLCLRGRRVLSTQGTPRVLPRGKTVSPSHPSVPHPEDLESPLTVAAVGRVWEHLPPANWEAVPGGNVISGYGPGSEVPQAPTSMDTTVQ